MRFDIVAGAIFPDHELSDHTAKGWKLSQLQGQHPTILVLSCGGYCLKDRRQAEGLVVQREIEVACCWRVTFTTDNITQTNEYRSGAVAQWPFLSDAGRIVKTISTSPRMETDSVLRTWYFKCDGMFTNGSAVERQQQSVSPLNH
jgi:peroxiredoxin